MPGFRVLVEGVSRLLKRCYRVVERTAGSCVLPREVYSLHPTLPNRSGWKLGKMCKFPTSQSGSSLSTCARSHHVFNFLLLLYVLDLGQSVAYLICLAGRQLSLLARKSCILFLETTKNILREALPCHGWWVMPRGSWTLESCSWTEPFPFVILEVPDFYEVASSKLSASCV